MNITDRVANEYRRRLAQVMEASKRDLPNIKFDAQNAQQLGVAVVYATIIEIAEDCAVLLHRERSTAVPAILRSLIESYADLCSVLREEQYIESMTATFVNEKLRLLRKMRRSPENPSHADLAQHIDVEEDVPRLTGELADYEQRGFVPLTQEQRFVKAKLLDTVEALYWQLCLHGHNNIAILEQRHIRRLDGRLEVVAFEPNGPEEIAFLIDALLPILADAGHGAHAFFGSSKAAWYQEQLDSLQAFRREIAVA